MFMQILPTCTIRNICGTLRRTCILILGIKGLIMLIATYWFSSLSRWSWRTCNSWVTLKYERRIKRAITTNYSVGKHCEGDKYSTARKYWCIFRDTAAVELQFVSPV